MNEAQRLSSIAGKAKLEKVKQTRELVENVGRAIIAMCQKEAEQGKFFLTLDGRQSQAMDDLVATYLRDVGFKVRLANGDGHFTISW